MPGYDTPDPRIVPYGPGGPHFRTYPGPGGPHYLNYQQALQEQQREQHLAWAYEQERKRQREKKYAPSLQLQPLSFYESGTGVLKLEQRRYSTNFPQSARYIMYDLMATNLKSRRDRTYRLEQCYCLPNGKVERATPQDWIIRVWYSWGWGWTEPGHWTPGSYRVEIRIDEAEFAEGSFTIG